MFNILDYFPPLEPAGTGFEPSNIGIVAYCPTTVLSQLAMFDFAYPCKTMLLDSSRSVANVVKLFSVLCRVTRGQSYKTFDSRNLRIFIIS